MESKIKKLMNLYFDLLWIPLVLLALITPWIPSPFGQGILSIAALMSWIGILIVTIAHYMRKRWKKGLLNLIVLFAAIPGFFIVFILSSAIKSGLETQQEKMFVKEYCQRISELPRNNSIQDEEYAVYSAAFESIAFDTVALNKTTRDICDSGHDGLIQEDKLPSDKKFVLVSSEEWDQIYNNSDYRKAFQQDHGIDIFLSFSRAGFNKNNTRAFLNYIVCTDKDCMEFEKILFSKEGPKWQGRLPPILSNQQIYNIEYD